MESKCIPPPLHSLYIFPLNKIYVIILGQRIFVSIINNLVIDLVLLLSNIIFIQLMIICYPFMRVMFIKCLWFDIIDTNECFRKG